MSAITIYHNPRCSKSRATLDLVERQGVDLKVIEYLQTPPTAKELEALLAKLGIEPELS
jgi:arsenate reductase (glutaredoxin)